MNKKFFSILIITVISFTFVYGDFVYSATKEERVAELKRQIDELNRQAEIFKDNILSKQKESATIAREVSILNSQISSLQAQISATSKSIESTGIEILSLQDQIFSTGETIKTNQKLISDLMVEIYERDKMSTIAVFLKNDRLSDFAREAQQISEANQKLYDTLKELKQAKINLEDDKADLENKKAELERLNNKHLNQKGSLSYSKTTKDQLLKETKGEEKKFQELLSDAEKKEAQFFYELQALENEVRETGSFIVHVKANPVPSKGAVFQWPYDKYVYTQGYGMTSYAKRGAYGGSAHSGVDIVSGYGSPIGSIGDGIVLSGGYNDGFGNWIAIQHDNGLVSIYGHMNDIPKLVNNSRVKAGDTVGFEGSTGNSTGSHLHLSVYKEFFTYVNKNRNGQVYFNYWEGTVNPLDYLPKR